MNSNSTNTSLEKSMNNEGLDLTGCWKILRKPFDKLRVNGEYIEMMDHYQFVVSALLSLLKHCRTTQAAVVAVLCVLCGFNERQKFAFAFQF